MEICPSCVAAWLIVALVSYVVYKKYFGKKFDPSLLKEHWERDVVYLVQYPRPGNLANYSPFCMKVEMFLKINKIPYENIFTTSARSRYGLLPFIELNGKHYADSQLIIEILKENFKIPTLSPRDEAISRAIERLADNHTAMVFAKYKLLEDTGFLKILFDKLGFAFLLPIAKPFVMWRTKNRIYSSLGGEFTEGEFKFLLRKDLNVFRDILADQKYLMGEEIQAVDCAVFSQLATLCYLEVDNEVKRIVTEEYPTLQKYQENIIKEIFPKEFVL